MFFNKFPHRANYTFASAYDGTSGVLAVGNRRLIAEVTEFGEGITNLHIHGKGLRPKRHLAHLTPPPVSTKRRTKIKGGFDATLGGVLKTVAGAGFGMCADAYLFQFDVEDGALFYGMGEKTFNRLELSGLRSKFYNTDVWSDFHFTQWEDHPSDPPYLSIPYLVVREGDRYVGILLNTAWPAFIETPGMDEERVFVEWQRTSPHLTLGAMGGEIDLWVIEGPSLAEVTRKYQQLIGVTPLPPTWALGYHQSRWEYAGEADLMDLDAKFAEHRIPCDGLWLDIGYMDGFRVFTTDREQFPTGVETVAKKLKRNRRKLVPILDPGIKREEGFSVFDEGLQQDVFCLNPEGRPYVGMVWPGETVFADFTLPKPRRWWSDHVKQFGLSGFDAAWIDMNDPSTGPVDPTDMLFNKGREPHFMHRNEYALGMQMATYDGFRRARPTRRPFLLSRSGSVGTARYSAIWTGDNVANYFYLRSMIPTTLNLSLSGVPFNGPDMGGFGGDPTDQLMTDWFKAGFLFPFFRNHSVKDSRRREPWTFEGAAFGTLRRYIQLRYKFLPYLYNLFIDQEAQGDAILRPLIYHYDDDRFAKLDDQFLVGDAILQAPLVSEERTREVEFPKGNWYDARRGDWERHPSTRVTPDHAETPLYFRNGAIVPTLPGLPTDNRKNLRQVEIHLFLDPEAPGQAEYTYRADDGETFAYRKGKRSSLHIDVKWTSKAVTIVTHMPDEGYGDIHAEFVIHGGLEHVSLNGEAHATEPVRVVLTGRPLTVRRVA
jgi:alpha-glucosidase